MLILPTSFNHLSESYFLCHLKHSFLKAMFRWCQAQNTHKSSVRPNTLKILFFFLQKCGEEAEGGYCNHFSSSHSEANTYTITLLGRNACTGRSFMKKCELIDWMMLPICTVSDEYLNVHFHIHCGIWDDSKNPSLTC